MIYDCFTFFNESELLEIRLEELGPIVDKFVICEGTYAHGGNPKPLNFNINNYPKFKDKIIYLVDDDFPFKDNVEVKKGGNAWINENHQRDYMKKGLTELKDNDYIIVSDLDEIPSRTGVEQAIELLNDKNLVEFQHKTYYYFVNYYVLDAPGGIILKGNRFKTEFKGSPQAIRNRWGMSLPNYLKLKSGWHFGYLGGVEKVIYKLKNFAHQEYNNEQALTTVTSDKKIMLDMHKRPITRVKLDGTFPEYLVKNKNKFKEFIDEDM